MFYAYILQSVNDPGQFYRGHTFDLKQRVTEHNTGKCPHTSKYLPWTVKFYAAFNTLKSDFEAKLAADPQFAASPTARKRWFYERSPYYDDDRYRLYPVGIER